MTLRSKTKTRRQHIWNRIRALRAFKPGDVLVKQDSHERDYLQGLERAGYIARTEQHENKPYELINDCGIEAPRVRADGSHIEIIWEPVWRSMRVLGEFTREELLAHIDADKAPPPASLSKYIVTLLHAGWLVKADTRMQRRSRGMRFRLLPTYRQRPCAPQIATITVVYDSCSSAIVWQQAHVDDPMEAAK